jgi:DNA-directed RNA polymerase subunit RPC12/RpoP
MRSSMIEYQCAKCSRIIAVHPATVYVACCGRYARQLPRGSERKSIELYGL